MNSTAPVWHKIWHLGDDVTTDALAPGAYMQHGIEEIAKHCLENTTPTFARDVRAGDVIVAGRNFGIGSSREQAASALVHLGVAAVIAPSYGGLYFRNAFNLGLLLLTCGQVERLQGESELAIYATTDATTLSIHLHDGDVLACEVIPDFLLSMVRSCGLLPSLKLRRASPLSLPNSPLIS